MSVTTVIQNHDRRLDSALRKATQGRLCVDTYEVARLVFQAVVIGIIAAAAIYPEMQLPRISVIALTAIALGPNVVEAWLTRREQ